MTGKQFAQFISDQAWTKEYAAGMFGVDQSTITRLKNRKTVPGPIARLCCLFVQCPRTVNLIPHELNNAQ